MKCPNRILVVNLLLCAIGSGVPLAALAVEGEQWEYKVSMSMEGFSIPASTVSHCQEPGFMDAPPPEEDSECKTTDFQKQGNKMSWKVQCPEGEGRGEMTILSEDQVKGFTDMIMEGQTMRMDMDGKRVGTCDLATARMVVNGQEMMTKEESEALKKKAEEAAAAGNAVMAKAQKDLAAQCDQALKDMSWTLFANPQAGDEPPCPAQKVEFCKQLKTPAGAWRAGAAMEQPFFSAEMQALADQNNMKSEVDHALSACGMEAERASFIKNVCDQSESRADWPTLIEFCLERAETIARKHCQIIEYGEGYEWQVDEKRYEGICTVLGDAQVAYNEGYAKQQASPTQSMKKSLDKLNPFKKPKD